MIEQLSRQGQRVAVLPALDPQEHAHTLYQTLRRLDSEEYDVIIAEPAQSIGLGIAINDRLTKASFSKE